jgi:hypothetical protein
MDNASFHKRSDRIEAIRRKNDAALIGCFLSTPIMPIYIDSAISRDEVDGHVRINRDAAGCVQGHD